MGSALLNPSSTTPLLLLQDLEFGLSWSLEGMTSSSLSLSFSSSIFPSPISQSQFNYRYSASSRINTTTTTIICAYAPSSSPAVGRKKMRHWKEGEHPGLSQTSIPSSRSNKTPIKNIKKKLDRKNQAKSWANSVTEALSDSINNKQWLQALEV